MHISLIHHRARRNLLAIGVALTLLATACGSSGGVDVAGFCNFARAQDSASDDFEAFTDPVALEGFVVDSIGRLEEASRLAPDEIKGDIDKLLAAQRELRDLFAGADWNFLTVIDEASALLDNDEFDAVQDSLDSYGENECGIAPDGDDEDDDSTSSDSPPDLSFGDESFDEPFDETNPFGGAEGIEALLESDIGRETLARGFVEGMGITQEQAFCFLDTIDIEGILALSSGDPTGGDVGSFLAALDDCGISFQDFG